MSYFPDYRKETDKLNDEDRAAILGFRIAIESALSLFNNLDDMTLSIEREIAGRIEERLKEWLEVEEIEFVCSLFDHADYLPEDIDLVDANNK